MIAHDYLFVYVCGLACAGARVRAHAMRARSHVRVSNFDLVDVFLTFIGNKVMTAWQR